MKMTVDDIQAKKDNLYNLWSDLFDICKSQIDGIKTGTITLRASMLRELMNCLRVSEEVLERMKHEAMTFDEDEDEDNEDNREGSIGKANYPYIPPEAKNWGECEQPLKFNL